MRISPLVLVASAVLTALPATFDPAAAQRPPFKRGDQTVGQGAWDLLGETRVGYGVDRDIISVGRSEDEFRNRSYDKLRLTAERGDIRMRQVRLRYINGHTEEIAAERILRVGEAMIVDLPERRSFLSQIELVYGARGEGGGFFGRWNQPRMKVYGFNRGGLPPRDLAGWDDIGQTLAGRGDDNVTIQIGRQEGRFGMLRLKNDGQPLNLRSMSVRFGNGETQQIRLDGQTLDTGAVSRPIDVDGATRFIERVVLRFDRLTGPNRGQVTVFGSPRPVDGRPLDRPAVPRFTPPASWIPLGEQDVMFRGDRDTIRLANDETWYRSRSFDKLHFQSSGADVEFDEIRVIYINGYTETVKIGRTLRRGASLSVDLPGNRSYLREIEMRYRTAPGSDQRGTVKVFGEPVRR